MKKIFLSLIALATLSASAQQPIVKREHIATKCNSVVNGRGENAFAIEGLKQQMDGARTQIRRSARQAQLKAVEPMLTTLWAQGSPYNRLLPSTGGLWGSTPQTGCVATAMAQILKHFDYPAASIGRGSYSPNGTTYRSASTTTTFAWDQMLNRYSVGYTEAQAKAVGELMRDCGYCSNMVYTTQGSGTTVYDAGYGLSHNMQYDSLAIHVRNRMFYNDAEWKQMIYSELQAGRPVLYDAVDPALKMGHAFVFDGMDADGRVHVNWGWAGSANGYFDIDQLTPTYSDMYGQQYSYNFSSEHKMIVGFKPQARPDKDEHYESFFAMTEKDSIWAEDDNIMLKQTPIYNYSHLCFNGLLALVIESEADGHAVVLPFFYTRLSNGLELSFLDGLRPAESFYPSATLCDTDGRTPRPDGTYQLYLISWATQEMQGDLLPQYIRFPASYVGADEENFGVWEADIVGGHWDPKSFRRYRVMKEETGVESVHSSESGLHSSESIFNLSGQRVNAAYKGIVVRNGKKVLK